MFFCLVSGNDYAKMTFDMGDWDGESECDGDNNVDNLQIYCVFCRNNAKNLAIFCVFCRNLRVFSV